ncbi:DUF5916 domain-containing protein [Petrimonas sp.]|uniref:carbohydrate binding family 9 domain-containing protein n=1 Tax=Petrimonas sp. TaxID=2023866 RepID=UPI003F511EE7
MNTFLKRVIVVLVVTVVSAISFAQEPVQIQKITGHINFDGHVDEEVWQSLPHLPMVVNTPNFGSQPSEVSEVMITYDDEYFWVGARLFTKDPTTITANSMKRDEMNLNSDVFGVLLDTYNDNENAYSFSTMPTGARTDVAISDDASLRGVNPDWNTFWDVKTSRDDKGWYVEMRIPFTSLRFQPEDNITTMGVIVNRYISYLNEMVTYPAIDPRYGQTAHLKPSLATEIQLEIPRTKRPVYISPYIIGGYERNRRLNAEKTEYVNDNNTPLNAGIDIKYSVTSNLTLDLTVNPDFAQVEADNQQVNMTRYSLFFPEKRAFFQEGSNIFDFNLLGFTRLFHSRNIGLRDGQPVTILGGARLYGSAGKWDLGVLNMQTEKTSLTSGENFGVIRARREVINPYSYVGGMVTSRVGTDGHRNFAYGLDGNIRVVGDDYVFFRLSQTFDNKITDKLKLENKNPDDIFAYIGWQRRRQDGFYYMTSLKYTGQHFTPGVGYVQKQGLYGIYANIGYGFMPGEKSKIFLHGPTFIYDIEKRVVDGGMDWHVINPGWQLQTNSGLRATADIRYEEQGAHWDFPIWSIIIPKGDYKYITFNTTLSNSPAKKLSYQLRTTVGQFYDGETYQLQFTPRWNVSSKLQIGAMYSFNALRFPKRPTNDKLDIHMTNINALYMFDTKLSVSAFVQYVNTSKELISNLRFRYNPSEGNDLYIVFNDSRRVGSSAGITPTPPSFYNNTVMLKYTHTFTLKL